VVGSRPEGLVRKVVEKEKEEELAVRHASRRWPFEMNLCRKIGLQHSVQMLLLRDSNRINSLRSVLRRCVVWKIVVNVSQDYAVSIFRVDEIKMDSSETLVSIYQTARRHVTEDRSLGIYSREKHKSP
jgi:hypothetical protein